MKHCLAGIILIASVLTNAAATWTFHVWRDNLTSVCVAGGAYQQSEIWRSCTWDFGWDQAFPGDAYSGIFDPQSHTMVDPGYEDTQVIEIVGPYEQLIWAWISGGYPDYSGSVWDLRYLPPTHEEVHYAPGEYWIDFSQTAGVGRMGYTQPDDFGKWAWDGSINPSWVEPLTAAPSPGKGKKLGHSK